MGLDKLPVEIIEAILVQIPGSWPDLQLTSRKFYAFVHPWIWRRITIDVFSVYNSAEQIKRFEDTDVDWLIEEFKGVRGLFEELRYQDRGSHSTSDVRSETKLLEFFLKSPNLKKLRYETLGAFIRNYDRGEVFDAMQQALASGIEVEVDLRMSLCRHELDGRETMEAVGELLARKCFSTLEIHLCKEFSSFLSHFEWLGSDIMRFVTSMEFLVDDELSVTQLSKSLGQYTNLTSLTLEFDEDGPIRISRQQIQLSSSIKTLRLNSRNDTLLEEPLVIVSPAVTHIFCSLEAFNQCKLILNRVHVLDVNAARSMPYDVAFERLVESCTNTIDSLEWSFRDLDYPVPLGSLLRLVNWDARILGATLRRVGDPLPLEDAKRILQYYLNEFANELALRSLIIDLPLINGLGMVDYLAQLTQKMPNLCNLRLIDYLGKEKWQHDRYGAQRVFGVIDRKLNVDLRVVEQFARDDDLHLKLPTDPDLGIISDGLQVFR
ncbi:hypothetical protein TRVA0_038S00672 [Trichomonascus vanleenenianus]|uniref:uncharacterized protein n=1 Tax=Trichomonascus vanleenenianus TaxID=2268995 RepID=UPI003EC9B84D